MGVEFHADFGLCSAGTYGRTASSGSGVHFLGLDLTPNCFCSCAPTLTCPATAVLECAKDDTYPPNDATGGQATVSGESCGAFQSTVTYNDKITLVEPVCHKEIARTFTASLDCADLPSGHRTLSCLQTLDVKDTKPPELLGLPDDTSTWIPCEDPVPPPPIVTANDACGPVSLEFQETTSPGRSCPRRFYRNWTATDQCGNAAQALQVISLIDKTAPYIRPEPIEIACDASLPFPVVIDNCNNTLFIKPSSNYYNPSSFPNYSESDMNQSITRTYRVEDTCDNYRFTNQYLIKPNVMVEVTVKETAINLYYVLRLYLGRYPSGMFIKSVYAFGTENGATMLRYYLKPGLEFTVCQEVYARGGYTTDWRLFKSGVEVTPLDFTYADRSVSCVSFTPTSCRDVFDFNITNTRVVR